MGETSQIVSLWRRAQALGEAVCLATVVHVEGSSYRKPGARMLITLGGERAGSISGGCLEGEICRKAWWLTAQGPSVQRYQSSFEEDAGGIPWGLGCGGTVWVLLERDPTAVLTALEAAQQRGEGAVVPARLRCTPGNPLGELLGTAAVFPQAESLTRSSEPWRSLAAAGDLPMAAIHQALRERLSTSLAPQGSRTKDGDSKLPEWFIEYLAPPPRLTIFGAGDDALPIARFAEELGWRICVADGRSNLLRADRFPAGTALLLLHYNNDAHPPACGTPTSAAPSGLLPTPIPVVSTGAAHGEFAVVLTHSWEQDRALLHALLPAGLAYLGVLGPRHRTLSLLEQVAPALGWTLDDCWANLHAPVGLDLGARDPAAIALSIVAELQATAMARSVTVSRVHAGAAQSPMVHD
jgi:xanthine dehydrogenase accessory factor